MNTFCITPLLLDILQNGVPLTDLAAYSDGRIINEPGIKRFVITSAQVTDSGRYTCMAESEAGEARVTYDLQVLGMSHS